MTFLPLTKDDLSLLSLAKSKGYKDEWNENMLNSAINANNFFGVKVLDNDKVLGYMHYSVAITDADVNSVFVFPEYRGLGIGLKLLSYAEKEMISKNVEKIFLEVRESNLPAIKLYKKASFKNISVRKKYYDDGETAVVMLKEIKL